MASAETKTNDSLTAIIFAVFAVACIVAFLVYRGSDVGQLPKLVGNLGGKPLLGFEAFRDSVVGLIAACLIGVSWFGLGGFVSSLVRITRSDVTQPNIFFVSNTAIGAAVWSLIWFFPPKILRKAGR